MRPFSLLRSFSGANHNSLSFESVEFLLPFSFQCFVAVFSGLVTSFVKMMIFVGQLVKSNHSSTHPLKRWFLRDSPLLINVNGVNWCKNCLCQILRNAERPPSRANLKAIQCIFENQPIGFARVYSTPPLREKNSPLASELILWDSQFSFLRNLSSNQKPPPPPFPTGRPLTKVANLIKASRPLSKLHLTRRKPERDDQGQSD